MKRLLRLSLLLNLILLGAVLLRAHRLEPMPRPVRGEVAARPGPAGRVPRPAASPGTPTTPWGCIESGDPRQLIENLRRVGCPEETIRDLVVARVCRDHRTRLLELRAEWDRTWTPAKDHSLREWRQQRTDELRLRDELKSELEALLGQPSGRLTTALLGWPEGSPGEYLPLDQRRRIREVQQRYRLGIMELEDRRLGAELDAEQRSRLRDLRQLQDAEIAALLSPAEYEEWRARESAAAEHVRRHLPPSKSEAEFRQIVRLAQEFRLDEPPESIARQRFGLPAGEPGPEAEEYRRREAAFEQRLTEVLGEDRMAEQRAEEQSRLQREQERDQARAEQAARAMIAEVAAAAGVPETEAQRFFDRMQESESTLTERLRELEQSLSGTPEERKRLMNAAVREELERIAVEVMGERGREFVRRVEERSERPR